MKLYIQMNRSHFCLGVLRQYKSQEETLEEAARDITNQWHQALRSAEWADATRNKRNRALQALEQEDARQRKGEAYTLTWTRGKEKMNFPGLLWVEGGQMVFEEKGTWHRVAVKVPDEYNNHGAAYDDKLRELLYSVVHSQSGA